MAPLTYDVTHSSNLDYRKRLDLAQQNAAEYNRLWCSAYSPTVWERLMEDAGTRQFRKATSKHYQEGGNCPYNHIGSLSGFNTNTSKAVYTHTSFKTGLHPDLQPSPVTMRHPILHRRFMHKHKIEYLTAIRPDTETSNQALRMLGTYETDYPHAAKANVHIAPLCPAPEDKRFHPDVRLSGLAYATAQQAYDSLQPRNKVAEIRATYRPRSAHPVLTSTPAATTAAPVPAAAAKPSRPASAIPAAKSPAAPPADNKSVSPAPLSRSSTLPAHGSAPVAANLSRPASARLHAAPVQQQPGAEARFSLRPASARHSPDGPGALGMLRTMVTDATTTQVKPQLVSSPRATITHRVAWGPTLAA